MDEGGELTAGAGGGSPRVAARPQLGADVKFRLKILMLKGKHVKIKHRRNKCEQKEGRKGNRCFAGRGVIGGKDHPSLEKES